MKKFWKFLNAAAVISGIGVVYNYGQLNSTVASIKAKQDQDSGLLDRVRRSHNQSIAVITQMIGDSPIKEKILVFPEIVTNERATASTPPEPVAEQKNNHGQSPGPMNKHEFRTLASTATSKGIQLIQKDDGELLVKCPSQGLLRLQTEKTGDIIIKMDQVDP